MTKLIFPFQQNIAQTSCLEKRKKKIKIITKEKKNDIDFILVI